MNKIIILVVSLIFFVSFTNFVFAQNETNESVLCGDMICDFNETLFCPSDCDNCTLDLECDDEDLCTIDKCEGTPKNCVNTLKDCNDGNPATSDECVEGKCKNTFTTECKSGDNYCPIGCSSSIDSDCEKEDLCKSNRDCNDNDPCTNDLCEGLPKSCNHEKVNGCISGNVCMKYGTREIINGIGSYCSKDNEWKNQKPMNSFCNEDYECITNACSSGVCMEPAREPTLIEKIIGFILKLLRLIKG